MNDILERIRAKLQKFKEEEFKNPLIIECRNKIADFGEKLLFKMESEEIVEDDVNQLMGVFRYITDKYLEELPEIDDAAEEIDETADEDLVKKIMSERLGELSYSCEQSKLMICLTKLVNILDLEKIKEQSKQVTEKLEKLSEEELESRFKNLEKEWAKDPFVFEIGASVSRISLFEKLMGKQPELEEFWKELNQKSKDKGEATIVE